MLLKVPHLQISETDKTSEMLTTWAVAPAPVSINRRKKRQTEAEVVGDAYKPPDPRLYLVDFVPGVSIDTKP